MAPMNDQKLAVWIRDTLGALVANPERYGVKDSQVNHLNELATAYLRTLAEPSAEAAPQGKSRNRGRAVMKTATRGVLRSAVRKLLKEIRGNPALTDIHRAEIGLPSRRPSALEVWRAKCDADADRSSLARSSTTEQSLPSPGAQVQARSIAA